MNAPKHPSTAAAKRLLQVAAGLALIALAHADTFDVSQPAGDNFDTAEFRLWLPDGATWTVRGLVVLVPGSNGDGRDQVDDEFWRTLARDHHFGLVGVRLTDKPHEDMAIEHYVDVRRGSGAAFLAALRDLAERAGRPEVARAPLLLWGMSAGGEFNYELALWKPERVLGFVVNKGGIYYHAIAPPDARSVPGLFFIGEKDLAYRNDIIRGVYSVNRRFRAQWALVVEPGVGHEVARSRDLARIFYEELIELRLASAGDETDTLRPLEYEHGFHGDPRTGTATPAAGSERTTYPTAWLPSERLARAWEAAVAGRDF